MEKGMKIGILCAGDREFAPFVARIQERKIIQTAMLTIHEGTMAGLNVAALYSGVCKVNAAIAAMTLIDRGCDAIINAGTAGGMDPRLELFDTVVCTQSAYHDVDAGILTDFHPWMDSVWFDADETLLRLAKQVALDHATRTFFGRMVTGEQFVAGHARDAINEGFAPLCADMETAAVAHVCYARHISFIAVRTITDTASHDGAGAFIQNCAKAAQISADFTCAMLEAMHTTRESAE